MAKNEAKIKFTAETGGFNDAIKKANSDMSQLRAELKLNDAQMKTNGTSIEALENKHKILADQLTASESKTEALTQKVNKAVEIYGENSEVVAKLKTQLLNTQTAEEKIKQAISACNDELTQQRGAADTAESATEKLTNTIREQQSQLNKLKSDYSDAVLEYGEASDEAKQLESAIGELSGELKQNQSALADAANKADDLDQSLDNADSAADGAGDGFTVLKGTIADLASNAIQAAIGKLSEFIGYLAELPSATMEARQDMSTLETSFDNVGFSSETATNTWKEMYKVFGEDDRAVEASNMIAKMSKNQQDLNDWVTITTGIWGTYQDSLPVEGLAEAAMETARTGTVTGNFADALNWSSEAASMFSKYMSEDVVTAEDAFNVALLECSNEQERQQLITETLTALYGDAAQTYRETSAAQMEAKEATAEHMLAENDLAVAIEPVTTAWQEMKTTLLESLQPAIETVSNGLNTAIGWMNEHPAVMKAVAAAVAVVAAGLSVLAIALGIYTIAQWAANSAMLVPAAICLAIVAAIAAVVAVVVLLAENWDMIKAKCVEIWEAIKVKTLEVWNAIKTFLSTVWNGIKTACLAVWNSIKNAITTVVNAIKTVVTTVWNAIKTAITTVLNGIKTVVTKVWNTIKSAITTAVNAVKTVITTVWNGIKATITGVMNTVKSVISNVWNGIKSTISNVVNGVKTAVTNGFNNVKNTVLSIFGNLASNVINVGTNIVQGIWNGISNGLGWIKSKITGWVGNVTSFIKSLFGIHSPSRVMRDEVGRYLAEGVAVGMTENVDYVKQAAEEMGSVVLTAAQTKLDEYSTYNDLTLADEVEFWGGVRQMCEEGTDARLEADKKYFDAKQSLNDKLLESESDAQREQLSKITINWEKSFKAISKEIKKQAPTISSNLLLETAEKRLDEYKVYNELTLADEVAFWDDIRLQCEEGTEARLEADKKYFDARNSLNDELLSAEQELQDALNEINKKVEDRTQSILDSFDLFEDFEADEKLSIGDMFNSLSSQVDALQDWEDNIDALRERIGDTALFDELESMGLKSLNQVRTFNRMTEAELDEYMKMYDKRERVASRIAKNELKDETTLATQQAYQEFNDKCTELGVNVSQTTALMHDDIKEKFESIAMNVFNSITKVSGDVSNNMVTAHNAVTDVLAKMKTAFETFNPKMKLPHFSISGVFDMASGSVPKINVEWYKDGAIFTKPTLFNTPYGLKGVGEAGAEAVLPIEKLENYISGAIERAQSVVNLNSLAYAIEDLANRPVELNINGRRFAVATASDNDGVNGLRSSFMSRGLVLD